MSKLKVRIDISDNTAVKQVQNLLKLKSPEAAQNYIDSAKKTGTSITVGVK